MFEKRLDVLFQRIFIMAIVLLIVSLSINVIHSFKKNSEAQGQPAKLHVDLVILGHTAHGKTTLASAISRVLSRKDQAEYVPFNKIDNPPEVLRQGVPIAMARVEFETQKRHYTLFDFPRQNDLVKALITGAVQADGAILVVSAPDGPMPQTREQIQLARQLGVPNMVVALNKVDMLNDQELLGLVEIEIRELLNKYGFPGVQIVRVSALKALESGGQEDHGISGLINAMDEDIPTPEGVADKPFLMPVEDVFAISGRGTVVTGRIERGRTRTGDEIEIVGFGENRKTVVLGLEMFQRPVNEATAGDKIGALLRGIAKDDVERGQVLAAIGSIIPHERFKAELYVLTKQEGGRHTPFFSGYRPQFHLWNADVTGSVKLLEEVEMAMPGDRINIEAELIVFVALERGVRFAIREGGRTVGLGAITEIAK